MTKSRKTAGYFRSGLPYNRLGHGPRILVVFQGLLFENKPHLGLSARLMLSTYSFLLEEYTTYVVTRKPGLPDGYSMQNMADDYAVMIREEFGRPVDVIGTSTGGSIAQHFPPTIPIWFAGWCSMQAPTPWGMLPRRFKCAWDTWPASENGGKPALPC